MPHHLRTGLPHRHTNSKRGLSHRHTNSKRADSQTRNTYTISVSGPDTPLWSHGVNFYCSRSRRLHPERPTIVDTLKLTIDVCVCACVYLRVCVRPCAFPASIRQPQPQAADAVRGALLPSQVKIHTRTVVCQMQHVMFIAECRFVYVRMFLCVMSQ